MSSQQATTAQFRGAFFAELGGAWRTSQFWIAVVRQSIPVVGVAFLAWPALQIGVFFVLQSWLMLSLYMATDLTFDPKYNSKRKSTDELSTTAGTLAKNLIGSFIAVGILLGLFGGFMLVSFFPGDAWNAFVHGGWHERSFLYGLAALIASCLLEAVRFTRSLPQRTPEQIEADDMRIATTFYRVIFLFMASFFVGFAVLFGIGDLIFVVATSLVMLYFEVLPRSAASLIASLKNSSNRSHS